MDRFDAAHPEALLEVRFYRILAIMMGSIAIISILSRKIRSAQLRCIILVALVVVFFRESFTLFLRKSGEQRSTGDGQILRNRSGNIFSHE